MIKTKYAKEFNQADLRNCVIGIGCLLDEWGDLSMRVSLNNLEFYERYGISYRDAVALFLANYRELSIGMENMNYDTISPNLVYKVLYLLADKYERNIH
jgi:hypothetical protein